VSRVRRFKGAHERIAWAAIIRFGRAGHDAWRVAELFWSHEAQLRPRGSEPGGQTRAGLFCTAGQRINGRMLPGHSRPRRGDHLPTPRTALARHRARARRRHPIAASGWPTSDRARRRVMRRRVASDSRERRELREDQGQGGGPRTKGTCKRSFVRSFARLGGWMMAIARYGVTKERTRRLSPRMMNNRCTTVAPHCTAPHTPGPRREAQAKPSQA